MEISFEEFRKRLVAKIDSFGDWVALESHSQLNNPIPSEMIYKEWMELFLEELDQM